MVGKVRSNEGPRVKRVGFDRDVGGEGGGGPTTVVIPDTSLLK